VSGTEAVEKSGVFEWHKPFKRSNKLCKLLIEVVAQKGTDLMQMLKKGGILFVQAGDNPLHFIHSFIHLAVCLTTGPKLLPKPALHIVRSRASSFK